MKKKHIKEASERLIRKKRISIKENKDKILYSAVVLDEDARDHLLMLVKNYVDIPLSWKKLAHHMTIIFNEELPEELKDDKDKRVLLHLKNIGISEDAIAVEVEGYPSTKKIPHITVAIPKEGKPVNSNYITDWIPIEEDIILKGKVTEVRH